MKELDNLEDFIYIPNMDDNNTIKESKIGSHFEYWEIEDINDINETPSKFFIYLINKEKTKVSNPFNHKKFTYNEFIDIYKKLEFLKKLKES